MNRLLFLMLLGTICGQAQVVERKPLDINSTMIFEENKGQIANQEGVVQDDILFTLKDKGVTVFFRKNGLSYQWSGLEPQATLPVISEASGQPIEEKENELNVQTYRVDMVWEGAQQGVTINPLEQTGGYSNYYLAHCAMGIKNVKNYKKIVYKNLYPGINLEYYINTEGHLKYDVILQAGADPSSLSYAYNGATPLLGNGKIRINTPLGFIEEQVPVAWVAGFVDEKINVEYRKTKSGIGYNISRNDKPVVIDPEIIWATYYGGTGADAGYSTKVDPSGNVLLAGETTSTSAIAAAPGCITTKASGMDAFIVKFNSEGSSRAWATYYGGSGSEGAKSMALDPTGNVYIVGSTTTNSGGLPNTNYQTSFGGGSTDAFLAKFDNSGGCLWATYYGSNNNQRGEDVAVDGTGNVYIAGYTDGGISDIDGSPNGHDKNYSNPQFSYDNDAFLVKFNSTGTTRLWATYYGGEYDEQASGVYVDPQDNVYLAGETGSGPGDQQTDIATQGAYKTTKTSSTDGFLVKFDAVGTRQWGTYFGGAGDDEISAINRDQLGNIYIVGSTFSTTDLGTTATSYQQTNGGGKDAFVAKLSGNGSSLLWATYLGGSSEDLGHSTTVDKKGHVFLSGRTKSSDIASKGFDNTYASSVNNNYDAFVVMFSVDGASILWSSYYGGTNFDYGNSITKDFSGLYMAGTTASPNLVMNGFQNTYGGVNSDAFLMKIEIPEIIEETFPALAEKSGTTPVSVKLNTVGSATVKFWSRGISGAKDVWQSETISPTGTTFTKNLSTSDLTDPIGILYYFEVTDISQANYQSTSSKAYLHYSKGDNTFPDLRFGSTVSDYQIIAAPLELDNKAITVALDELGSYNIKKWRLFRYDSENVEYPTFSNLEPGLGYWLIVKNSTTIDPGAGQTVPVDDDNPFTLTLKTGWNLIGNPYNFKISWQDVLDYNSSPSGVGTLKMFSAGSLVENDVLDAYRGAFVFSDAAIDIDIPVERNAALGGRKGSPSTLRNPIDENQWEVPITLSHQSLTNEVGAIGMHPQAKLQGKDKFDEVSVPLLEGMGFFEMQVQHSEVHASFNKDVVPTAEDHLWRIDIRRDDQIPLELSWDNSYFGSGDKQLFLIDPTTFQVVDMRQNAKMKIGTSTTQLWVVFGSQSYIDEILDEQIPLLGTPYPVPSNGKIFIPVRIPKAFPASQVIVEIYDVQGKAISKLTNDKLEPGEYTFEWNSENTGLYFVRLRIGDRSVTRKIITY